MALEERGLRLSAGGLLAIVVDPDDPDNSTLLDSLTAPAAVSTFGAIGGNGGGADVWSQLGLLQRKVDGIGRIVDAAFIGARSPDYAGNINVTSRNGADASGVPFTAAANTIAQHQVDPDVHDTAPLAPALHVFRSLLAESTSIVVNRPGMVLEAIYRGTVEDARALLELRERLSDGASRTGAWIEANPRVFSIQNNGTFYSRGGLFLFGSGANAVLRGGDIYVEDGRLVAVLSPGVTSDDDDGNSMAFARNSSTTATIGDLYGDDLGVLTFQGNVRALNPSGADTYFRADSYRIDGQATRPTTLDASTWGLWVDSDTDILYFWDGATDTALGGGSAAATTEYCGYPSWSDDFGHAGFVLDRAYSWGSFGLGTVFEGASEAVTVQNAPGFESDGSRQTSYVSTAFAAEDAAQTWKWATGVPEGFSAWGASGLGIKSKLTGLGAGDTLVVTLTAYNPSTGASSAATRTITSSDASYVELTITPPGTWQGRDLLRFELNADVTVWGGVSGNITFKVGQIRTDWS